MSRDNSERLRLCELRLERTECYKRILAKRAENAEMQDRIANNDAHIVHQQRRQIMIDLEIAAMEQASIKARIENIKKGNE